MTMTSTSYLESGQTSQGGDTVLYTSALTSGSSYMLRGPQALPIFDQLSSNPEVTTSYSGLIICQTESLKSDEFYFYYDSFITAKGYRSETARGKDTQCKVLGDSTNMNVSGDMSPSGTSMCDKHIECCQPGKLTHALMSIIFIGASLNRYDGFNCWLSDNIQSHIPPQSLGRYHSGSKLQPPNHIAGFSGMTIFYLE